MWVIAKPMESIIFAFIIIVLYLHNICIKLQWKLVHNNYVVNVNSDIKFIVYKDTVSF